MSICWLGHSTFIVGLGDGRRLLFDPWLGNPDCPPQFSRPEALTPIDVILVSHGHRDHVTDVESVARATGATVVAVFELGALLSDRGLRNVKGMGIGGTQRFGDLAVTMTQAAHSGSMSIDGRRIYAGGATGFIVRSPATPTFYFAGDTGLFGDMKVIGEVYRPEIAFLPIGDHYTMGPDTAAIAAEWLGVRQVVPMHWGTYPELTGTPASLKEHLAKTSVEVLELRPGETAT